MAGFDDFGLDLGGLDFGGGIGTLPDLNLSAPNLMNTIQGMDWPTMLGDTASKAGGGGGSLWGDIGGIAEKALPFVKAGIGAGNIYAGIKGMEFAGDQQKTLDRAVKTSEAASAPGIAAAGQLIPAGTQALLGGKLPPALEAQVEQFKAEEKAKARQRLAHMGITDSTMIEQYEAWIDMKADELRSQLASGLLGAGVGAVPGGVAGQAGQIAGQQAGSANTAVANAQKALMDLLSRSG